MALRPSVLHVTQPVDGGVGAYVATAAADQARRGWRVAVACPPTGRLADDLDGLGVPRLDWTASRAPGPADVVPAARLRRIVRAFGPDVVHLHSSKAGLAGRLAIRGRVPTLFQPHGWSWPAARGPVAAAALSWERLAVRWTARVICVGEGEAELARRHGVTGDLVVVRNGVDLRRFRPAGPREQVAARTRHGVPAEARLAVCVGRVTRQKGQDLLLAAWERVAGRDARARLAIVGDGPLLPALRSRAVPRVHFAGAVADPRSWYAAADVVVLPSRWEGLPLTALEALATGRPLVACAVPGLAELVAGGVGAAVAPGDEAALAEALLLRLGQPALAAAEGVAAAALAGAFDVDDSMDSLAGHTLGLLGGATGAEAEIGTGKGAGAGTGVGIAPGDLGPRSRLRKTSDERGFDEHCQMP
ncbi:glycosyltransferase [Nonomuraea jiangxiensis]|uniref:Glycosyltransferase involved in cell wall bisynthesis n=1 Tax=Nonomuraea jiangxiensis TaxID=633440 RepID=A0A1G9P7U4_9ACTN|nr:glycosyltransferase [Nonomuraea jiangxiensis]SDL94810.1 Glycosyltransferase involved in cell wall bisynthesis [Nonomuraea jiangxiensis]